MNTIVGTKDRMTTMPMGMRKFRVDDNTWLCAAERAAEEGTTLSVLLREWLEDYWRGGGDEHYYGHDSIITNMRRNGFSLSEIASVTGLSVSGVSRALKRLSRLPTE